MNNKEELRLVINGWSSLFFCRKKYNGRVMLIRRNGKDYEIKVPNGTLGVAEIAEIKDEKMETARFIVRAVDNYGQAIGKSRIRVEKKLGNCVVESKELPIPNGALGIIGKKIYS